MPAKKENSWEADAGSSDVTLWLQAGDCDLTTNWSATFVTRVTERWTAFATTAVSTTESSARKTNNPQSSIKVTNSLAPLCTGTLNLSEVILVLLCCLPKVILLSNAVLLDHALDFSKITFILAQTVRLWLPFFSD